MSGPTEALRFDPSVFDADFFADYDRQLDAISVEDQASLALADILTIEQADGTEKSYAALREEIGTFFASDAVRSNELILNRMVQEYAQACLGHAHGAELSQDTQLNSLFPSADAGYTDSHAGHNHSSADKDDDYETDPLTGKKTKKKRAIRWFDLLLKVSA